jgi:hypothetical protein
MAAKKQPAAQAGEVKRSAPVRPWKRPGCTVTRRFDNGEVHYQDRDGRRHRYRPAVEGAEDG